MEKLVEGFKKFQSEVFLLKRKLFTRLSQKQEPRARFITCSDAHVHPSLLTQTYPASSSFCGVRGTLWCHESTPAPGHGEGSAAVKNWMDQAETVRAIVRENYADFEGEDLLVKTIQENVRVQLDHLKTDPTIAVRLRHGMVTLHGWVY